jgi:lysophospholipase L1-like esterase
MKIFRAILTIILLIRAGVVLAADALPVSIHPDDKSVHFIGRFDSSDKAGPRCAWPASAITIRFRASAMNIKFASTGADQWQVIVDGKETEVLKPKAAELFRAADGLSNGEHTVTLVKRTEASVGTTQFLEFQFSQGGQLLPAAPAKRRIEIIGDSISAGYGNEGANQNEHFSPNTENAYLTYGAIAARAVGADFVDLAWSGKKMAPDNTLPESYDRTLPGDARSKWDFAAHEHPDVVLINLATNDFGKGNPAEEMWVGAYETFLKRVRTHYPNATIFCAVGPMMSDGWPKGQNALSTARAYLNRVVSDQNKAGDARIFFLEFAPQDQKNGLGSDWHPSIKTNEIMAERLEKALGERMGWEASEKRPEQ